MEYLPIEKKIKLIFSAIAGIATFYFCVMRGVGVLGTQIWKYLESGVWKSISANDVLIHHPFFPDKLEFWARYPRSMHGLHEIFDVVNGGILLLLCGVIILSILYPIIDDIVKEYDRLEKLHPRKISRITVSSTNH